MSLQIYCRQFNRQLKWTKYCLGQLFPSQTLVVTSPYGPYANLRPCSHCTMDYSMSLIHTQKYSSTFAILGWAGRNKRWATWAVGIAQRLERSGLVGPRNMCIRLCQSYIHFYLSIYLDRSASCFHQQKIYSSTSKVFVIDFSILKDIFGAEWNIKDRLITTDFQWKHHCFTII